jgi:tetratricopeptide (TPR) repeat protein
MISTSRMLGFTLISICCIAEGNAQSPLYSQGLAAYREGQWNHAIVLMTQVEAESPGMTDALLYAGKSYLELNHLQNAETSLAKFVRMQPASADALYTLGLVQQRENKPRESLFTLTEAAKLRTPTSEELRIAGLDYVLLNDYPDAIHWLEKAVTFNERNVEAWYSLGRCDYAQSRFSDAEKAFDRVLALDPQHTRAAENLGLVYSALNRPADAEKSFRSAIALAERDKAGNEWPYLDYGSFLLDQDRSREAIPLLKRAVEQNPQCTACQEKLGRAFSASGNLQEGVHQLEEAVTLNEDDPHLHYELGLACRKAGLEAQAKKELEQSAKLYGAKSANEPK